MGLFACFDRGGVGGAVPDGFLPQMRADELLMQGTAEAKLGKVGKVGKGMREGGFIRQFIGAVFPTAEPVQVSVGFQADFRRSMMARVFGKFQSALARKSRARWSRGLGLRPLPRQAQGSMKAFKRVTSQMATKRFSLAESSPISSLSAGKSIRWMPRQR